MGSLLLGSFNKLSSRSWRLNKAPVSTLESTLRSLRKKCRSSMVSWMSEKMLPRTVRWLQPPKSLKRAVLLGKARWELGLLITWMRQRPCQETVRSTIETETSWGTIPWCKLLTTMTKMLRTKLRELSLDLIVQTLRDSKNATVTRRESQLTPRRSSVLSRTTCSYTMESPPRTLWTYRQTTTRST